MRRTFAFALAFWAAAAGAAAPTLDSWVSSESSGNGALEVGNTESVPVTLPAADPGRAIHCPVTYEDTTGTIGDSAVVLNPGGVVLTPAHATASNQSNQVRFFYALDAALPAAGSYTVTVTTTGDSPATGALGLTCWIYSANAPQSAPPVMPPGIGNTTKSMQTTVPNASVGDVLMKATSAGTGNRTHTHSPGTWVEVMDRTFNSDSDQSAAHQVVTSQGQQTARTDWSANENRVVQVVAQVKGTVTVVVGAQAIPMKDCPDPYGDGIPPHHRDTSDGTDWCPPVPSNIGLTPVAGTKDIDVVMNTTSNGGPMNLCLAPTASALNCLQITAHDPANCEDWDSVNPSAGVVNATLTASSFGATRYTWACQPLDRPVAIALLSPSVQVAADPGGSPGTGGIEWHPGHYIMAQDVPASGAGSTNWNAISSGDANTYFEGGQIFMAWGALETSQGVYNWAPLDSQIAAAAAIGKRAVITIRDVVFGSPANAHKGCPADLDAAGHCYYQHPINDCEPDSTLAPRQGPKLWQEPASDRLAAFVAVLGARYNGNATVTGVQIGQETAVGICNGPQQASLAFDNDAYTENRIELMQAARAAFPNKVVFTGANHGPGTIVADVFAGAETYGIATSQPDYYSNPGAYSQAMQLWPSYLNKIPLATENQRANACRFGPTAADKVQQSLCPSDGGVNCLNFVFWPTQWNNTPNVSNPDCHHNFNFAADIVPAVKAAVDAGKTLNDTCPTSFAQYGGCNTE